MTHEAVPRLTFHILLEGIFSGHKDEDVTSSYMYAFPGQSLVPIATPTSLSE